MSVYATSLTTVRGPLTLEAGLREPDTAYHGYYDAYLVIWERFCRTGAAGGNR